MAGKRYGYIPESYWAYLGPGFKGLNEDMTDLEAALAASSGSGGSIITTGPYTLDPKRAPAGTIVAIPDSQPLLTHIGNRFTGAPTSTPVVEAASATYGSITTTTIGATGTGTGPATVTYASGGVAVHTAADTSTATFLYASQVTSLALPEFRLSTDIQLPTSDVAAGASIDYVQVWASNRQLFRVIGIPGFKVDIDATQVTGGREALGVTLPAGRRVRFECGVKLNSAADSSNVAFSMYEVQSNGGEILLANSTWSTTTAPLVATDTLGGVQVGRVAGAGQPDSVITVRSIRVAHGPGAYAAGPLKAETLYPEPI